MIAAREGDRGEQALRPQLLERRGREGEVVEPPLHLRARQGLVAEVAHGRAQRLRGEQAAQHARHPTAACRHPLPAPPPCPGHRRT